MATAKALREKRKPLAVEIRRQADLVSAENRDFKPEEQAAWEKVNADYNALTRQIDLAERVESVEGEQTALVGDQDIGRQPIHTPKGDGAMAPATEEQRCLALQAWARVQSKKPMTDEHIAAVKATRLDPSVGEIAIPLYNTRDAGRLKSKFRRSHPANALDNVMDFKAAMSDKSGPGGAYLVPPETLIRELEVNMLAYGGMRQVAGSLRTNSGERMSWPTADDTTNTGVQLEESTTIGSSVEPTLGKVYWDAYKFSSKPILVPYELMQDSAFNLAEVLGEMLGERLGRITNTKYTTGSGANTAKGILVAASSGKTSASSTAIAADEIIDLEHSIDPAYRNGAGFMCHDLIIAYFRKLKDGVGRPLWQSGWNDGAPDTLHNYPITINQDMASTVATTNKTLLFGQLFKYKIRTVGEVRMYHLQERYRDTDQDAFIAFIREDGNLLTAGTAPVKYLIQV